MIILSTEAINTAIKSIDKLISKLASMRPNEEFTRDDIRATISYLCQYQDELAMELKNRNKKNRRP